MNKSTVSNYLKQIKLPEQDSHKGQNGKLMIIGGSDLFHAASKWSLDIASKFVDMVFYASVPSNNELVQAAKGEFWNGIVIQREDIENYIEEADCVLIGPGMTRSSSGHRVQAIEDAELTSDEWNSDTEKVVNYLLAKYPHKKWVIDAGALQMVDPSLLNENCIITPHQQEAEILLSKINNEELKIKNANIAESDSQKLLIINYQFLIKKYKFVALLKGVVDKIISENEINEVEGGNPGMTKGGTGDVLAGLVAALYCMHDVMTAAVVGSYINKKAGDELYKTVGPYFNASDLVNEIPKVLWAELNAS